MGRRLRSNRLQIQQNLFVVFVLLAHLLSCFLFRPAYSQGSAVFYATVQTDKAGRYTQHPATVEYTFLDGSENKVIKTLSAVEPNMQVCVLLFAWLIHFTRHISRDMLCVMCQARCFVKCEPTRHPRY